METESGTSTADIKRKDVRAEMDFLQVIRLLERENRSKPRVGDNTKYTDENIVFRQSPSLKFEAETLQLDRHSGKTVVNCNFFGLFGGNSPLPVHFTEYARERLQFHSDATFTDFVNLFNHRMLSFFYKAWASGEPAIQLDRIEEDLFSGYLGSFGGLAANGHRNRDAMPDHAKLYYMGHFSNLSHHAEGLRKIVTDYFGVEVEVRELTGNWIILDDEIKCCLGRISSGSQLGLGAVLGDKHWDIQSNVELVLGPLDYENFKTFFPGQRKLRELKAIMQNYLGLEIQWTLRLLLDKSEVPDLRLGGEEPLGYSSWLGSVSDNQTINNTAELAFSPA